LGSFDPALTAKGRTGWIRDDLVCDGETKIRAFI
jgi:hypothetical protein